MTSNLTVGMEPENRIFDVLSTGRMYRMGRSLLREEGAENETSELVVGFCEYRRLGTAVGRLARYMTCGNRKINKVKRKIAVKISSSI